MTTTRDMTVGELISALQEFPDYYAVVPFVGETIGIITDVRQYTVERQPVVLIGECDLNFNLVEGLHERPTRPAQTGDADV